MLKTKNLYLRFELQVLCEWNPLVNSGFSSQKASDAAKSFPMSWCYHEMFSVVVKDTEHYSGCAQNQPID